MQIDWVHFTPLASLAGGLLIGLAAAMLVLVNGQILGVSGIVGGLMRRPGDSAWRLLFLAGMLAAPALLGLFVKLAPVRIDQGAGTVILAGLLVGVGVRIGGGCTSGHGICGLSRLSPRSLVATALFVGAGVVTVFVIRHIIG